MRLLPSGSITLLLVLESIFLFHVQESVSVGMEKYATCSSSFQCGNIENVSYPFWGGDQPEYCGAAGFELDCEDNAAEITIMEETYKVLKINNEFHTFTVARTDYLNNICPSFLHNTTLNFNLFDYALDSQNLTLYYDCSSVSVPLQMSSFFSEFNCSINRTNFIDYLVTENVNDQTSSIPHCNKSVIVPAFHSAVQTISKNSSLENLIAAVNGGFELQWYANNAICDSCKMSGGLCGSNPSSEFACYCLNQSYPSICSNTTVKTNSESERETQLLPNKDNSVVIPSREQIKPNVTRDPLFY